MTWKKQHGQTWLTIANLNSHGMGDNNVMTSRQTKNSGQTDSRQTTATLIARFLVAWTIADNCGQRKGRQ
jgi:hypothetical protein